MPKIDIIAAGKMRDKNQLALIQDYGKRMAWDFNIIEVPDKNPDDIDAKIIDKIVKQAFVIALDERGKSISSRKLASKLDSLFLDGQNHIQFLIGGANGFGESIHKNTNFCLSFGVQTWPHMMVRIMLLEQLYRAQQIIAGHPYHRD